MPSHVRVPTLLTHPERLSAMVIPFEKIIDFAIRVRREDVTTQQSLDFAHATAPRRQDFDQPDFSIGGTITIPNLSKLQRRCKSSY